MTRENPALCLRPPPAPRRLGSVALSIVQADHILGRRLHARAMPRTERGVGRHRDIPLASRRIPAARVILRLRPRALTVTRVHDNPLVAGGRMPALKRLAAVPGGRTPPRPVRALSPKRLGKRPLQDWNVDALPIHHSLLTLFSISIKYAPCSSGKVPVAATARHLERFKRLKRAGDDAGAALVADGAAAHLLQRIPDLKVSESAPALSPWSMSAREPVMRCNQAIRGA